MNTLPSIQFLRSSVPGKVPTPDVLPFGWFAINHYDGDVFVKRFRSGIGTDVVKVGSGATTSNLIWVTKDGKDTNSGRKQGDAKATIKAAVAIAKEGTVIRVTAGVYEEDNPIKLPPQVSIVGDSLREVTVIPLNSADLFYVGNGNYISDMSYVKEGNTYPISIAAFDPNDKQYINQSTYVQNCTNFIPNSIGLKINGEHALGPLKSMVLDSFTQYNANGIGISITNEGYAQLVSLFTICSDTSVFCDSGGGCDITNSNSSFGNKGLVAFGVSPLKYTGTVVSPIQPTDFVVELNISSPTLTVTNAVYNHQNGLAQIFTEQAHKLQKGMSVELSGLAFTCSSSPPFPNANRYQDAANLIIANRTEISDKSLAAISLDFPDFYFPGDSQTTAYSRYKDSYRLIQKNRREIVDKSLASIAAQYPDFYFPGDSQTNTRSRYFDAYRLIQQNKNEIVGIAWTAISQQYPALVSTESKCKRDLGYFVDAVSTDIFTGGNKYSRDYTRHYFNPNGTPISNGINDAEEISGALVGYTSVRELMKAAITNQLTIKDLTITADPEPLNGLPYNTNPTACDGVQHQINSLVGIITTVIGTSNVGFLTTFNENLGTFTPGSSKCLRDLGYFVDAISTDLFIGGNKYARDFTKQYFNNAGIAITNGLVGEESQSIYAFNAAREFMKAALTNQLNFKDLTITADPSPSSGVVTNTNPASCSNVQTTIDTLVGIVTTVIGTNNVGFLTTFSETTRTFLPAGENKCLRDIGFIVDAVTNDLKFNTNTSSIAAAKAYFTVSGTPISNGLVGEESQSVAAFIGVREYSKLAINNQLNAKDFTITADPLTGSNNSENSCANVKTTIDNLIGIITTSIGSGTPPGITTTSQSVLLYPSGKKGYIFDVVGAASSTSFTVNVGVSTIPHYYTYGGTVRNYVAQPYDGQVIYFGNLYYEVENVKIINGGSNYQTPPEFTFSAPEAEWGISAQVVSNVRNGSITEIDLVSSGRGYLNPPTVTISNPNAGINTAVVLIEMKPSYYSIVSSTPVVNGITTITLNENIPYAIGVGTTVNFYKQSRILASSHSMQYIGTGTSIERAIPVLGGVPIQENETVSKNGGLVVYTTTDQAGNFRIGDGVIINQNTGRISGSDYTKSLFAAVTPFILSLGGE